VFDDSQVAGTWKQVRTIDLALVDRPIRPEVINRVSKKLNEARVLLDAIEKTRKAWQTMVDLALDFLRGDNPDVDLLTSDLKKAVTDAEIRLTAEEKRVLIDAIVSEARSHHDSGSAPKAFRERLIGERGENPPFAVFALTDDEEWLGAGCYRVKNDEFDRALSQFEQHRRPRRELVPRIETQTDPKGKHIVVTPPQWVTDVVLEEGAKPSDFDPLFPYYFRTRSEAPLVPVVWIGVRDPHDNLRVLGEPMPEDPAHDYLSHTERRLTFRPDFYVLALPMEEVSRLVWNAELERPGHLDGCLAEMLEFDRQTRRRSASGDLIRLARDRFGRPPHDYPFRDFSGVQYYFHNHVRIGRGHIYFPEAEWGLSSISQLAYWRERMSSSGPFMGQLSVDIGNFYAPAPPRSGGRIQRTAWHSTRDEIMAEVWQQVRRGLESQHAGILADPDSVHLDEGLRFDHPLGRTFRDEVVLTIVGKREGQYTVWINGRPFTSTNGTDMEIALALKDAINKSPCGSLEATVEREARSIDLRPSAIVYRDDEDAVEMVSNATIEQLDRLQAEERLNPKVPGGRAEIKRKIYRRRRQLLTRPAGVDDGPVLLRIRSTVPARAAFVQVMGADAGVYEIVVAGRSYRCGQSQTVTQGLARDMSKGIRDHLFDQMVHDREALVTAKPYHATGLELAAKTGDALPAIEVRNDQQNLSLVFGSTLHVRIEQCRGGLSFANPEKATIGYNHTPFLINVPKQWRYRPGVRRPGLADSEDTRLGFDPDMPVLYQVSNRRWVAAGPFMATTTRLTTMEAANESARHAVNAILRHLVSGDDSTYSGGGKMFANWAEIWNPECNELDDLAPLRRLDEKLVAEGLPHVLDILRIVEAVDALPMHGRASHDPSANLLHLLQHAAEAADRDWGFSRETLYGLVGQAAERIHDALDPLGIVREGLKNRPGNVLEQLQHLVRSFTENSRRKPDGGGSTPP
jgi:hypothetical protein